MAPIQSMLAPTQLMDVYQLLAATTRMHRTVIKLVPLATFALVQPQLRRLAQAIGPQLTLAQAAQAQAAQAQAQALSVLMWISLRKVVTSAQLADTAPLALSIQSTLAPLARTTLRKVTPLA